MNGETERAAWERAQAFRTSVPEISATAHMSLTELMDARDPGRQDEQVLFDALRAPASFRPIERVWLECLGPIEALWFPALVLAAWGFGRGHF